MVGEAVSGGTLAIDKKTPAVGTTGEPPSSCSFDQACGAALTGACGAGSGAGATFEGPGERGHLRA